MILEAIDWSFIILFFIISLAIGIIVSKKAGANASEFFLSGRNMPWWLLGVSMVATTFAADTPNFVSQIVREDGISGNWVWWAFLLTGMLTVFVYSKLWRRSKINTDLEFYEMRYTGKPAAFLRGFRAVYLGAFFNIMIMANVSLAAIKLGNILLGLTPIQTLLIASTVTVIYSSLGGLKGVLLTDFFQFIIAMIGSVWAAYVIVNLPKVGGLDQLLQQKEVVERMNFFPDFSNKELLISLLIIPLAVQWWSAYYPGAEPGGGGYIAQRMLSAKTEKHALGATLFFNFAHYALRPWPWLIIALCSVVVFPNLSDIQAAFPNLDPSIVRNDLAYPAMLTYLPHGLLGLVIASLIAAFTSTISTHLNWGSSYIVNDFYKRFVNQEATDKQMVNIGRITTVVLMIFAATLALFLNNAMQAFNILLSIGAGTGLIYILRWFWWRINAYTEITGMLVSLVVVIYFELIHSRLGFPEIPSHYRLLISVGITTALWLLVTFLTKPDDQETLEEFYKRIQPSGPGWNRVINKAAERGVNLKDEAIDSTLSLEMLCVLIGTVSVYSALFATGYWIYKDYLWAVFLTIVSSCGAMILVSVWGKIHNEKMNKKRNKNLFKENEIYANVVD